MTKIRIMRAWEKQEKDLSICRVIDCNKSSQKAGSCYMHYERIRRHGDPNIKKPFINRTHGRYGTTEYRAWYSMKQRCLNKNHKDYESYAGRGITVCERWLDDFQNFYDDMGDKPTSKHSLDRVNNDGNYEPSNCRWATASEQALNRRPRRKVV